MIDATAGRDDVLPSIVLARAAGDGSLDPAWRGVWQSAMERTQVQSWFHASPDAGASSQDANQTAAQGNGDARARSSAATTQAEAENAARGTGARPQPASTLPTTAYVDLRSGAISAKAVFGETAYANPSPVSEAGQTRSGQGTAAVATSETTAMPTDAAARAEAILRDAFDLRQAPVRWHVSFSDGAANIWLGVPVSHADMVQALVPALRDAMRREGIPVRTLTVNGVVLPAQHDAAQIADRVRVTPRR